MKFERRNFIWRMNDPWVRMFDLRRPQHVRLEAKVLRNHLIAKYTSKRRGPNKHGRHFHPLSTEVLDAIRLGCSRRIMRGAGY